MAKLQLPRGVVTVEWKNKTDKTKQFRYRVRVNKATYKCDRLFEDPQDAIRFLELTKTPEGRQKIREDEAGVYALTEQEKRAVESLEQSFNRRPFSEFIKLYIEKYIEKGATHPTKKRSEKIYKAIIKVASRVRLTYMGEGQKDMATLFFTKPHLQKFAKKGSFAKKPLEDFYLDELNPIVATEYVIERLKVASKGTVKREITQLATIINKLPFIVPHYKQLIDGNPFTQYDKTLLKNAEVKRDRRLSQEEEVALMNALREMRNPAMYQIALLALCTGMRRSEVLFLEWDNIKDGYIELPDEATKAGSRKVMLNADAVSILSSVKRYPGTPRLFSYTVEGFKTNMSRAIKKSGLVDFRFHDLRREHISRLIQMLSVPNPVAISEYTGMKSVRHLQDAYIEPMEEAVGDKPKSLKQVMRSVGHKSVEMTQHYTTFKKS